MHDIIPKLVNNVSVIFHGYHVVLGKDMPWTISNWSSRRSPIEGFRFRDCLGFDKSGHT